MRAPMAAAAAQTGRALVTGMPGPRYRPATWARCVLAWRVSHPRSKETAPMRKMLAALIGAAASVTMITGAGVASAAAGHPASAHAAVTGTEHFQAVGTSLS